MIDALWKIEDLQELVRDGIEDFTPWGDVRTVVNGNLILFNYTERAQYAGRWNAFERWSRGLILNRITGEVVARPFDKFFNWGEHVDPDTGVVSTDARLASATEKLDGSLGIMYKQDGQWKIATRGSFTSDQAIWATEFLNSHYAVEDWNDRYTLLFEIIYPANRIVVDYHGAEGLFLIGVRDRIDGRDLSSYETLQNISDGCGFPLPKMYNFDSYEDVLEAAKKLSTNEEGWVVLSVDGERFKIKGDAYKLAHKLMTQVTFKGVLEAYVSGDLNGMIAGVPDEFLGTVKDYVKEIEDTVMEIDDLVQLSFGQAPKENRKEFAIWTQANCSKIIHPYMYLAFSGENYVPAIYKYAFRNRLDREEVKSE